jgi:hypothetical protein
VGDAYAYEEAVSRPAEEFRRKVRIGCQSFNVHRALWPRLRLLPLVDRYKYVSHKLLRWLTVFFLAAAAICFAGGLGALLGWRFGVGMMAVYALGGLLVAMSTSGKLATLRDILGAFVSTGIGVMRSLRGDRFQTWNPPASARGLAVER